MAFAHTTFRLDPKVVKGMDRLITDPPPSCFDDTRGVPRNRTELVSILIAKALAEQDKMKDKRAKDG